MKDKRHKWTKEELEELVRCYSVIPLKLTDNLIAIHGRAGCYTKAEKMKLNGKLRGGFPDISEWKESQKGYLAGIIDGEGTITIIKMSCTSKKSKKRYFYERAIVCVANTDYKLLDYLKSLKIGGLSYDKRQRYAHWKKAFQWSLTNVASIYVFLMAIEPYLVIKRDRALEVIEWLKTNRLKGVQLS